MKPTPSKPVRVVTGTVHLFRCPVCREEVSGTVEVEAHLGDLSLSLGEGSTGAVVDTVEMRADLPVVTRARNLVVRHDCRPTDVAAEASS